MRKRRSTPRRKTYTKRQLHTWQNYTFPALQMMSGQKTAHVAREAGLSWGTVDKLRKLETVQPRFSTIAKIITAYGGTIRVDYPKTKPTRKT